VPGAPGGSMTELHERDARIIEEFRANDGNVGGPWEGATMLLRHTKGATSGPGVNPRWCTCPTASAA